MRDVESPHTCSVRAYAFGFKKRISHIHVFQKVSQKSPSNSTALLTTSWTFCLSIELSLSLLCLLSRMDRRSLTIPIAVVLRIITNCIYEIQFVYERRYETRTIQLMRADINMYAWEYGCMEREYRIGKPTRYGDESILCTKREFLPLFRLLLSPPNRGKSTQKS